MLVTRYSPVEQFRDIRRGFDLINSIVNEFANPTEYENAYAFMPTANSREGEKAYYIELDLPGIEKDDINITVDNNILTISGERKVKNEMKSEDYYKIESSYGKFSRSFEFPDNIDLENIKAEAENGVLEIVIPKMDKQNKAKKIEIK